MIICYHGTVEKNVGLIQKNGFLPNTYFAFHLEDAIEFGGDFVFSVRFYKNEFKSDLNNRDWWQFRNNETILPTEIVLLKKYNTEELFNNKNLRKEIFEHNLKKD